MKKLIFYCSILVVVSITSCTSYDVADLPSLNGQKIETTNAEPIAHINTDLYGYYLFNVWPIITADPRASAGFALFTDTISEENAVYAMTLKAKELGANKVTNIKSTFDNTGVFTLFISWYKSYQVSGNAIKTNDIPKGDKS
jgi:hypothetical protein